MSEEVKEIIEKCISKKQSLLNLSGKNIVNIEDAFSKNFEKLQHVRYLNLSKNKIFDFRALSLLSNLEELDLSENKIIDIKSISKFSKLKKIYLDKNGITNIEPLSHLIDLNEVSLDRNEVKDIYCLSALKNLKKLRMVFNKVEDINALKGLLEIEELTLNHNKIKNLAPLLDLVKLRQLRLLDNQISNIEVISNFSNLEILVLGGNKISNINDLNIIEKLPKLSYINLGNTLIPDYLNAFDNPIDNHFDAIKLYLSLDQLEQTIQKLPEKVLLLGNHSSGKSTTLKALCNKRRKNHSTHVLNVSYLTDSKTTTNKIKVPYASCYDFGGQDFYHGIYRIFLKNASHVLLHINPATNYNKRDFQNPDTVLELLKKEKTHYFNLRYWIGLLNYIDSPLTIQLIQRYEEDLNEQAFSKQWQYIHELEKSGSKNELKGFYHLNINSDKAVSSLEKQHTKLFKQDFYEIIKSKQQDYEVPKVYLELLSQLVNQSLYQGNHAAVQLSVIKSFIDDYITRNRTNNQLKPVKVDFQISAVHQLIKLLSKKGLVLYDENLTVNQNEDIKNHILWLYPQKTIESIHKSFLSKDSLTTYDGKLSEKQVDKYLKSFKHPEAINSLLINNKVIFKNEYSKNEYEYIIPNYLPFSDTDINFEFAKFGIEKSDFVVKFDDFMPFGMINQFVTHFGKLPNKKLFWRDCIVFTISNENDDEYMCMLNMDMELLTIDVSVIPSKNTSANKVNILSYLFYCIMTAYWSYIKDCLPISYKAFELFFNDGNLLYETLSEYNGNNLDLLLHSVNTDYEEIYRVEFKDIKFKQLFYLEELFDTKKEVPNDIFLSRDGKKFINYSELQSHDEDELRIDSYIISDSNKKDSHLVRDKKTLPAQKFELFTTRKFRKMANIFISYSRQDVHFKDELFSHLGILAKQHHIYECGHNESGDWNEQIQDELDKSDIVILMMSHHFFNSSYIMYEEVMKVLINNQTKGLKKKLLFPILVRDYDYDAMSYLGEQYGVDKKKPLQEINNSVEKDIAILHNVSRLQFFPYKKFGSGENTYQKLEPIELWENPNSAYKEIAMIIRLAIQKL